MFTLVPPVGFNPSGNDSSNSTSFTTATDSTYFFTISLFQQNPPAANGQSLGPVNIQIVVKQLSSFVHIPERVSNRSKIERSHYALVGSNPTPGANKGLALD